MTEQELKDRDETADLLRIACQTHKRGQAGVADALSESQAMLSRYCGPGWKDSFPIRKLPELAREAPAVCNRLLQLFCDHYETKDDAGKGLRRSVAPADKCAAKTVGKASELFQHIREWLEDNEVSEKELNDTRKEVAELMEVARDTLAAMEEKYRATRKGTR